MFRTVLSPARYSHIALPANFYRLSLLAMIGNFAVIGIGAFLDRFAAAGEPAESAGGVVNSLPASNGVLAIFARDRWMWVLPVVVVLSLYVLLILNPQGPLVGPMMYQVF